MKFMDWFRIQLASGVDVPMEISLLRKAWMAGQRQMRQQAVEKVTEMYGDEGGHLTDETADSIASELKKLRLDQGG